MGACPQGRPTWKDTARLIGERLRAKYSGGVRVEFVELFSPSSFGYQDIMERVRAGEQPPFVAVEDEVIQSGGKISESAIRAKLDSLVAVPRADRGT
jgi:disulfide oxidoreductase YuzD